MPGTELAQRLWTDAQTDVHLRGELRASYRGRHDVLDALWWRAHPSTRSPGGRPDPATVLPELLAEVYSRRSLSEPLIEFLDPVSRRAVRAPPHGQELRALTSDLAGDAAALDTVLRLFQHYGQPGHSSAPGRSVDRRPRRRGVARAGAQGRRAAAKLMAGGALVGGMVMTGILAMTGGMGGALSPGPPNSNPSAAAGRAGADSIPAVHEDPFRIFDAPAEFTTGVAPVLGPEFRPLTIRSIPHVAAARVGFHLFAAQRANGTYCLVLQQPKDETDVACASRASIERRGLRLQAVVVPEDPGSAYPQPFNPLSASIEWNRNGVFTAHFEPLFP